MAPSPVKYGQSRQSLLFGSLLYFSKYVAMNRSGSPQTVCMKPGQGLLMQMLPALPLPGSTSLPSSSRITGRIPSAPGPQLPGFIGCSAGSVVPMKPPVSVCHQVSTMAASPLPTTS